MKPVPRALLRVFFGLETVLFIWSYIFGLQGIHALMQVRHANQARAEQAHALRSDIVDLEQTIEQFKRYPFYKEKHAREQLQMARKRDEIYYLD